MTQTIPPLPHSDFCRWGIIGGGDVCEKKGGPPLYKLDGCELIGVTRRNKQAGQDFAQRHGPCQYYDSIDTLLDESKINCVYVASPPEVHLKHVLACAQAGKHILCEKPMALDSTECFTMVEACNTADVSLAVAYYRRGYPSIQRAKEILLSGELGQVQSIRLNTQFPISHRLDLVHYFCGDVTEVGLAVSESGEPDLTGLTTSGAHLQTCLGFEETARTEQIRLTCENGELFIHDIKGGGYTIFHQGKETKETFPPLPFTHWGLVANFREHLASGTPLLCDGAIGRATSVVLDEISNLKTLGQSRAVDPENSAPYQPAQGKKFNLLV